MILRLQQSDQWGVYHVGNSRYVSKLEAVMQSRQTGQPVVWQYMHNQFSKLDWTQEPTQSLWELYSDRARQLREQNSYIMLMYSGGADSTNVLDVFERNDIPIDEIRMGYAGEISDPASLKLEPNQEIYHAALPRVRRLQQKWPNLKVTMVNMKPLMIQRVCDFEETLHYGTNSAWNPWQAVRFGVTGVSVQDWVPNLSGSKKMIALWGKDKTKIKKIHNRFAIQLIDTELVASVEQLPDNCGHEYFYWGADAAKIMIKQGHVLKNFLRAADSDPNWFDTYQKFYSMMANKRWLYDTAEIAGQTVYLSNALYNTLMYPFYDPTMWDTGKTEWVGVSEVVKDAFYRDSNLRRRLNNYMKQKFVDYKNYASVSDQGVINPMVCQDRPWFLEP